MFCLPLFPTRASDLESEPSSNVITLNKPRKRAGRSRRTNPTHRSTVAPVSKQTDQPTAIDHYRELKSLGETLSAAATDPTNDSANTLCLLDTSLRQATVLLANATQDKPHATLLALVGSTRALVSTGDPINDISKEFRLGTIGRTAQDYADWKMKNVIAERFGPLTEGSKDASTAERSLRVMRAIKNDPEMMSLTSGVDRRCQNHG